MNIMQCQFCKKPFASIGGKVCPACLEQVDKDFITVRDYIDEHRHSNIELIAEETEVPEQVILHLIKEGRLIMEAPGSGGGGFLYCQSCRAPIRKGTMCEKCELAATLSSAVDKSAASKPPEVKKAEPKTSGYARLR